MTQPVQVPIDVQVDGADQGVDQLNDLQAALAGVTVGAGAVDVGLQRVQRTASNSTFGSRGLQEAAAYQAQMSGLAATAAATHQSMSGLNNDVLQLSRSMPGGTQQMIQTVQATQQLGLSQSGQINQIRQLSGEFTKLAAATGTFAPAIATQFGDLNRQLASLDPSRVARFSDVVTTLQAKTGASVSGMLSFAQSIAPVAQQAGLGESSILGISSAFVKLGDDGGAAATAVNKILSDLNESVREGSNQMVAYANATGMTVKQFKALFEANPASALEQVTAQLGQPTAQSTYLLQTLGLDSARTQKALAELGQSGGLTQTINTAVGAYGNGSTNRAAAAALGNVDDKMQQLSTTAGQLGTVLEGPLLRPLGKFLSMVQDVAGPVANAVSHVAGSRVGGDLLATGGTAAVLGITAATGIWGLGRRLLAPAWAATLGTSGPAMSSLAGFHYGRAGENAEAAAMNTSGLLGFVGRRHNQMLNAGIRTDAASTYFNPEASTAAELAQNEAMASYLTMGRRSMSSINRGSFDFFHGLGAQLHDPDVPFTPKASLARRLISGGATTASLAGQGYIRMLQQPLVQAQQSPLDREFALTEEGGPGRRLLGGLGAAFGYGPMVTTPKSYMSGGGSPEQVAQDAAAASYLPEKGMKTAGVALGDFTKDVSGGDMAIKRFGSTVFEAGRNITTFAASALYGTAKAGASSVLGGIGGWIKANPATAAVGAAAGLGVGIYAAIKSANNYNTANAASYQNMNIYGTMDQFLDAMGQAGIATQTFAEQITAASTAVAQTVTTRAQATQVTPADVQAWGLPSKSKVVHAYTGSTAQIAAQISATNLNGLAPEQMNEVGKSLYEQGFSPTEVGAILKQVPTTGSGQLSTNQISGLVSHIAHGTNQDDGSFGFLHSWNALKGAVTGTTFTSSNEWNELGHEGRGHPSLSSSASDTLHTLVGAIGQGYSNNLNAGRGVKYSTSQALTQANQAMQAAIATNNAATVVATEQALTAAINESKKGITGKSAADIVFDGGLLGLLRTSGNGKVYGQSAANYITANGQIIPQAAGHMTPQSVTALQGRQRTLFGPLYGGTDSLSKQVANAISSESGNPGYISKTAIAMIAALVTNGSAMNTIITQTAKSLNTTSGSQLALQQAVLSQAQFQSSVQQIGMSQPQSLATQGQQALGLLSANGPNSQAEYQQGQQEGSQVLQATTSYYQQRLMAQFNYQIQSQRSTQDFDLQQSRTEQDYQIQDLYNQQDYYRQKLRATQDFNLQTKYAIQDAASQNDYDPYSRIGVQSVFSAGDLAENLAQQNQAMQQQVANLNKIRADGLSSQAIQTLGLSQTANAQQLQQLVDDAQSNPTSTQTINTLIAKRVKTAGTLYKDPDDVTYQRSKQQFDIQMTRDQQDYETQQTRLQAATQLTLDRANQDFNTQMTRNAQDLHDQDLAITSDMGQLQKDMNDLLHGQTVDWAASMVNTMKQTIKLVDPYVNQLETKLGGVSAAAANIGSSGAGSSGSSTSAGYSGSGAGTVTGDRPSQTYQYANQSNGADSSVPTGGYAGASSSDPGPNGARAAGVAGGKYGNKSVTPASWSRGFLAAMGLPISSANLEFMEHWIAREGGAGPQWGTDNLASFNPLNTTMKEPGSRDDAPGKIIQAYTGWPEGLAATVATLSSSSFGYPKIIKALRKSDFIGAAQALINSDWDGSGHYSHMDPASFAYGGIATKPTLATVADAGSAEAAIPLNTYGVSYLAQAISKYISSADAANIVSGGRGNSITIHANHYVQNYGHTFGAGAVKVVANTPQEIYNAMDKRQRMENLTGPRGVRKNSSTG